MKKSLSRKIKDLPESPGVYLFKDGRGVVLYIGKAKSLKDRVSNYLRPRDLDPKTLTFLEKAADIEVLEAPSEVDALLMEARLIKDIQPKFNIKLKDDKSFNCIEITDFDDFPKIWIVRETDEPRGRRYGPFTSAGELRHAIKVMQRIFRFATCTIEMREDDEKRRYVRPCLLYSIDRCTAPCADRVTREAYAGDVRNFERYMQGERDQIEQELENGMKTASREMEYERAGEIRDQIKALRGLARKSEEFDYLVGDITPIDPREGLEDLRRVLRLDFVPRTVEGMDIAQIGGTESVGSLVSFIDGIPFKSGYRRYKIKQVEGIDDYAMIREVVERRFRAEKRAEMPVPDVLLIDGGVGHIGSAAAQLRDGGVFPRVLLSLAKKEEILYRWTDRAVQVNLEEAAPALRLMMYVRDEAHRFAQHYHHLLRRKIVRGQ